MNRNPRSRPFLRSEIDKYRLLYASWIVQRPATRSAPVDHVDSGFIHAVEKASNPFFSIGARFPCPRSGKIGNAQGMTNGPWIGGGRQSSRGIPRIAERQIVHLQNFLAFPPMRQLVL